MADDDAWSEVGPDLLYDRIFECRADIEDAFRGAEAGLHETRSEEFDADDVQDMRTALVEALHVVERYAAPVAGREPWDGPVPRMFVGEAKVVYLGCDE